MAGGDSAWDQSAGGGSRFGLRHRVALAAAMLLHCAFVIPQWSEAYIDFGDGNYLYIARRIADGVVAYRDILAPQPPCHLYLGAAIVKFSDLAGLETPLYLFRAASLGLHLLTYLLVAHLARRMWGGGREGVLAGWIYLALPIGAWWSLGWQSEPLEIVFLLAMMHCALAGTRMGDVATGLFASLAALTNATAAPFLLALIVYMAAADRRRAITMAVPALALAAAVTLVFQLATGGAYLDNVVFNQAGTYPKEGFLHYAVVTKILGQGLKILSREGVIWAVAVLALPGFLQRTPLDRVGRGGVLCFCVSTMFSFVYMSKGGTVDYIHSLAEPAIAVLAGGALIHRAEALAQVWRGGRDAEDPTAPAGRAEVAVIRTALAAGVFLFALTAFGPSADLHARLWNQEPYELPDFDPDRDRNNIQRVKEWIDRHTEPGDVILAPPYYAFLTKRRLAGEYSEIFIWTISDANDRRDNNPAGPGWSKTRELAGMIARGEIPLILLDEEQTGRLPEVREALAARYRPLLPEPWWTLNTPLGVYVPADPAAADLQIPPALID